MKRSVLSAVFLLVLSAAGLAAVPKSNWTEFDGNKIHYYDTGRTKSRNALVLIHGWTCNTEFWKDSYSAFPKYRVITLDLIGHGKSGKPKAVYSMEYFARSVNAVLQAAKVEKAVLVGHSMGTPVARQFYRLYPEKTLAIVAVDGALVPMGSAEQQKQFFAPLIANFKENGPKFLDGMLQPVKDENLKKMIRENMLAAEEHVAVSAMEGMIDERVWINDKINVPVQAILAASPWWPANLKDSYAAVAPNIDFQMWNGVSHFLQMEKPKEFNEQVRMFVERNKLL